MVSLFRRPNEEGQGLVEYALILVLVAIVVIGILLLLGPAISEVYCEVVNTMQPGECGAITSVNAVRDGNGHGNTVVVTITVDQATAVTATWPGGSASTSCSGSCTITITTDDAGTVRVRDDVGGVMSAPYGAKL
jgi:pilus assembly protein Flp/PilA